MLVSVSSAESAALTFLPFSAPLSRTAAVPMTTQSSTGDLHSRFSGRINFVNYFNGQLPATEYPKLQFYLTLTVLYMILGGYWLYLCIQHRDE